MNCFPQRNANCSVDCPLISGSFGLPAAQALAGSGLDGGELAVAERIINLVDKSLIMPDRTDAGRWRLLETTRAYAADKLSESGEAEQVARIHAEFFLEVFSPFATESQLQAAIDGLHLYRREVDNLRVALTWAFSETGDSAHRHQTCCCFLRFLDRRIADRGMSRLERQGTGSTRCSGGVSP